MTIAQSAYARREVGVCAPHAAGWPRRDIALRSLTGLMAAHAAGTSRLPLTHSDTLPARTPR